ncbi:MAG: UPF0158 family protein [Chloroflexi bacterium]|nr:UPF0158 family protein [Chloroflexota bacterium]MCI0576873.1 UPF0158 family protein [Chloroflexota bacterium]MCI0646473.1 UPF0158 family protein [Chloroflexota bacterium]MCI0726175.1 UPF0158 family protein [Chloroflexota bacterium]
MRPLSVDWSELEAAFENASWEANYYLDLETGQVLMVMDETRRELETIYEEFYDEDAEETFDLAAVLREQNYPDWQQHVMLEADQVEAGLGVTFIAVPHADSREGYEDMEEFIATVQNPRLENELWLAIRGRGAFRRFKDVLAGYPKERERWFAFKSDRLTARIVDWLAAEGIESTNLSEA